MKPKALVRLIQSMIFAVAVLSLGGCGGGGGGGGKDDAPLDTTVDYDIAKVIVGSVGENRWMRANGADTVGGTWDYSRSVRNLGATYPTGPCGAGETWLITGNISYLREQVTGTSIELDGYDCVSTNGSLQFTLVVNTDLPKVCSVNPAIGCYSLDEYGLLTTAGDLPLIARIGDGGSIGGWSYYQETDPVDDDQFSGAGTDSYTGSETGTWKLEDQDGAAALVLTFISLDEFGVEEGSEITTFLITPSGRITGWDKRIVISGYGTITLSGTGT